MRISTEQLTQQLARSLAPLYVVHGNEPLLALEAADRIRAKARADGFSEREVLIAEQHFDWSQLRMSGQAQSLFASRRILELRIASGKPGNDGSQALQSYCERLPDATVTLISLPEMDWRGQKASWFGALDASGILVEAKQVTRAALPAWLATRLKAQEQSADDPTLTFIADKVEGNLMAAYQEVQKLALLFPAGKLSLAQVKEAVLDVARFDVFSLGEILLSGDAAHLVRVLEGLQGEGAAAPLVLWVMTEEVRGLARVVAAVTAGQPVQHALRDARVWGTRQTLLQRNISRYSQTQIEAALLHAARIDRLIKGLAPGDVWDELLQLGLRFAPKAAKAA